MIEVTRLYPGVQRSQLLRYQELGLLRLRRVNELGFIHTRTGADEALLVDRDELEAFADTLPKKCPYRGCRKRLKRLHQACMEHVPLVLPHLRGAQESDNWRRLRPEMQETWAVRIAQREHGRKGAEFRVYGAEGGREGESPPKATAAQSAEIWRLTNEGLSPRKVSERVFGDRRYHMRVRRIVGVS